MPFLKAIYEIYDFADDHVKAKLGSSNRFAF